MQIESRQLSRSAVLAGLTGLIVIFLLQACRTSDPQIKILENLDFSGLEVPVSDKISGLISAVSGEKARDADAWGRLAVNLYLHDLKDLAPGCYKRALDLDPGSFRWAYYQAIAVSEKSPADALPIFARARFLKPGYAPMLIRFGEALWASNKIDTAAMVFRQALHADNKLSHADVALAKIFLNQDVMDSTRYFLERAIQKNSRHREAFGLLAEVQRRSGEIDEAEKTLNTAQSLPEKTELPDPVFSKIIDEGIGSFWCRLRGDILLQNRQYMRAEKEFRNALAGKTDGEGYTILGLTQQHQGKWKAATESYLSALQYDSSLAEPRSNLSVVLFQTGQLDRAIAECKKVLAFDSTYGDAYLNLGTFYKNAGRTGLAIRTFQEGITHAIEDMRLVYQLAWIYATSPEAQFRNGPEALRLAMSVCRSTGFKNPGGLDALAAAYAENKQFAQAVKTARRAAKTAQEAGNNLLANAIGNRLKMYQNDLPFREEVPQS